MSVFPNYAARQVEKLFVLYPFQLTSHGWKWVAVCECGIVKTYFGSQFKTVKSCGCWKRENARNRMRKHGHAVHGKYSKVYKTWLQIKKRCENTLNKDYHRYGARGIRCEFQSFEEFYAEVGDHPGVGYTIDRYPDNKGNYTPGNVRWATAIEQSNNRRTNIPISYNGKTQTIAQWEREKGVRVGVFSTRYRDGWSVERMLCEPIAKRHFRTPTGT